MFLANRSLSNAVYWQICICNALFAYPSVCFLHLQTVVDSIGVAIWQMAVSPYNDKEPKPQKIENGYVDERLDNGIDDDDGEVEDDSESVEFHGASYEEDVCVALGCDDGCVRLYTFSDLEDLIYKKSLPRVSGEIS